MSGAFTILIVVIGAIGGRYRREVGFNTDFLVLTIAYPIGSAIMGALFGLGAQLMRCGTRSALVGMAALPPLVLGVKLSIDNVLQHWRGPATLIATYLTIIYGSAIGYAVGRR